MNVSATTVGQKKITLCISTSIVISLNLFDAIVILNIYCHDAQNVKSNIPVCTFLILTL